MYTLSEQSDGRGAVIRVIGVGGAGCNAVKHMINQRVKGVDFICANTDSQALGDIKGATLLQLGIDLTKGLGAGANPEIGRQAAETDYERIMKELEGSDMVFVTAGMGGGTGTGASPVIADMARSRGMLTVAVVTKPFSFEGTKRAKVAEDGLILLKNSVDSLLVIPNSNLLKVFGKLTLNEALAKADDILYGAVRGISDVITQRGLINVDFADVKTVMSKMGMAMMGTGRAKGKDRAHEATQAAIHSPLLDDINLEGAKAVLINITSPTLGLTELEKVSSIIQKLAAADAEIIIGAVPNSDCDEDELQVTIIMAGLGLDQEPADQGRSNGPPFKTMKVHHNWRREEGGGHYQFNKDINGKPKPLNVATFLRDIAS